MRSFFFAAPILVAALMRSILVHGASAHDYTVAGLGITHPWARATAPSQPTGGVFMTIENIGDHADRLIGASSPIAESADIHNTVNDNGVMRMRHVDTIEVPVAGSAELAPGGYHIMLIGLTEPLKKGSRVPVTLQFENAGMVEIEVAIESAGAAAPATANAPAVHDGHGAAPAATGGHNHGN